MNLIILGAPGSGKGTQAVKIKERYELAHISTGDLLRSEVSAETELGLQAKAIMDAGHLVSDEIVLQMVAGRLTRTDCAKGWILDGFPRTRAQAEGLTAILAERDQSVDLGLLIQVKSDEVVRRLSGRRVNRETGKIYGREELASLAGANGEIPTEGPAPDGEGSFYQRDDDREATIRERLAVFEVQTRPVIDFYQDLDKVVEIDGAQPMDVVSDALFSILRDRFDDGEQG